MQTSVRYCLSRKCLLAPLWVRIRTVIHLVIQVWAILPVLVVVCVLSFSIPKLACLSGLWWQQRHCWQEKLQMTICCISTGPDSLLQTNRKKNTDPNRGIDLCACLLKVFCAERVSKLLNICRGVIPEAGETRGSCCGLQETPGEKSRELGLLPRPGKSFETK